MQYMRQITEYSWYGDDPRHRDTETAIERYLERAEMARKAFDDSMHAAVETAHKKSACIVFDLHKKFTHATVANK